jgi:hypothetical protein
VAKQCPKLKRQFQEMSTARNKGNTAPDGQKTERDDSCNQGSQPKCFGQTVVAQEKVDDDYINLLKADANQAQQREKQQAPDGCAEELQSCLFNMIAHTPLNLKTRVTILISVSRSVH